MEGRTLHQIGEKYSMSCLSCRRGNPVSCAFITRGDVRSRHGSKLEGVASSSGKCLRLRKYQWSLLIKRSLDGKLPVHALAVRGSRHLTCVIFTAFIFRYRVPFQSSCGVFWNVYLVCRPIQSICKALTVTWDPVTQSLLNSQSKRM